MRPRKSENMKWEGVEKLIFQPQPETSQFVQYDIVNCYLVDINY